MEASSRSPLQSCKPNPGLQGFPLLSGLKGEIFLFCHHSKKGKEVTIKFRFRNDFIKHIENTEKVLKKGKQK
ncbi:hypothetical protein B0E44_04185 [Flavobacterium sp. A45]|nr:hypothetical protein B0E44_04185 [Flavobacterium sp. A45]